MAFAIPKTFSDALHSCVEKVPEGNGAYPHVSIYVCDSLIET